MLTSLPIHATLPDQVAQHTSFLKATKSVLLVAVLSITVCYETSSDTYKSLYYKTMILEVYGNEKRRLLSGEARTSGNSKLQAGNDFNHELASASVIVRANKEEL